jgi:hypothetical protein
MGNDKKLEENLNENWENKAKPIQESDSQVYDSKGRSREKKLRTR